MKEHYFLLAAILLLHPITTSYADQTLKECSHLSLAEGQYTNFYISESGANCCMCPKGTFLEHDCSANDPNSTICTPCKKKTYFPFGPHQSPVCIHDDVYCKDEEMTYIAGSSTSKSYCQCPTGKRNLKDLKCIDDRKSTETSSSIAVPLITIDTSTVERKKETTLMATTPTTAMVSNTIEVSSSNTHTTSPEYKREEPINATETTTSKNYTATSPKFPENGTMDLNKNNGVINITTLAEYLTMAIIATLLICAAFYGVKKFIRNRRTSTVEIEMKSLTDDSGRTVEMKPDEEKALLKDGKIDDEKEDKSPCASTSLTTLDETPEKTNEATPICRREVNQQEENLQEPHPQPPSNTDQHQCNCPREEDIRQSKDHRGLPSRCHIRKRINAVNKISIVIRERDLNRIAHTFLHEGSEYDDIKKTNYGDTPETSRQVFERVFQLKPRLTLWKLHDEVIFNETLHDIVAKEITGSWNEHEQGEGA